MNKPYFVALGDIHLSDRIWRDRPDVTGDSVLGLSNLIDAAIELNVPAVIVGDLYDQAEQRDAEMLRACQGQIDRAERHHIPVYALQGNHDKRPVPWYVMHEWIQHIGNGTPQRLGSTPTGPTIVAFDYDLHDRIKTKIESLALSERPQILFLHQAVKQALKFEGAWNCDLDWVPADIPLIVMGDIHTPWSQRLSPTQEALYTDSGCPRSSAEFHDRSVVVVNEDLTWHRKPVWTRPMVALSCTPALQKEFGEWLDGIRPAPEALGSRFQPFCRLTYTEAQVAQIEALRAIGIARYPGILWDDVIVSAQQGRPDLPAVTAEVPSRQEILDRIITGSNAEIVKRFCLDLLDARSPADALLTHRTQFLEKG